MITRAERGLPQRIHMVGIGGIGLSAIARILAAWGCEVSGSDLRASEVTRGLNALGIPTAVGHRAEQVQGAEWVVVSSAVPEDNPEIRAAREAGVPVVKRHQLLGIMLGGAYGIAVAGTHGKTTTSAMLAVMLDGLGLSPTFIVGGMIPQLGANARAGVGPHFVIEADEYGRTFHGLRPEIAVVTNVEMDHPDCYTDLADIQAAFATFLEGVASGGYVVACADSPALGETLRGAGRLRARVVTYGRAAGAAYRLVENAPDPAGGTRIRVGREGDDWLAGRLAVPGEHNALNATAALAVADLLGLDGERALAALATFGGVTRHFQIKGEAGGVTVVDDYAHHPTEIRATLAAARRRFPGRRVVAVFQPHTYSRVEALYDEFLGCFGDADVVEVLDVYAARAREVATWRTQDLAAALRHPDARYLGGVDGAHEALEDALRPGDVVVTLGAGDGYLVGERLLARLAGDG
jgi:UDP-N-acetylmuramate--alanine ligase